MTARAANKDLRELLAPIEKIAITWVATKPTWSVPQIKLVLYLLIEVKLLEAVYRLGAKESPAF
jgi:hypothetical protein